MEALNDKELIIKVKNGEIDFFAALVKKYTPRILNFITKKIPDRADAEDIVQNSFLSFYKAVERFEPDRPVLPYLFEIVRNEMKMHWRSKKKTVSLNEDIVAGYDEPSADAEWIKQQLNTLPAEQKKALELVSDGFSYREIAEKLGKPLNTIRTIIRRARINLVQSKGYAKTGK